MKTNQARKITATTVCSVLYTGIGTAALAGFLFSPSMLSVILFSAVIMTAFALVAARNPLAAGLTWLVLSPVLYPFARYPQSGTVLTFDRVYLGALALTVLLTRRAGRPSAPGVRSFVTAVTGFAAAFLCRALSTHPSSLGALQTFIDAILLPCIAFAVCRRTADSPGRLRAWAAGLMVCGTSVAVLGITEHLFGYELATLSGGAVRTDTEVGGLVRVSGPYAAPEVYALTLALTLAATLFWWMSAGPDGSRRRGFAALTGPLLAAVQITGMALSLFRVAWACALLVLFLGLGLRAGKRLRLAAVAVAVALGALILFVPLQDNDLFRARMADTDNVAGRFATYQVGLEIWRSAPVTGVGINQFVEAQKRVDPKVVWGVRSVQSPHSSFVGTLAEQGVIGFAALLTVCGHGTRMLRRLGRAAREDATRQVLHAAVIAGAVSYLAFSVELTMLPLGPSNAVLAVVLALAASAVETAQRRPAREKAAAAAPERALARIAEPVA
ncbi:O-antigen ligase [Streptomyces sp. TP-A0356]|uniref:O-antigen ligase family protein n=1 Tax=Streptomyces sp. TP-A0356 TaxID=1359208 RepID=UPI0006E29420|nr:O-antigen ligase family protein [Streptomyces sp. TP-A0356]